MDYEKKYKEALERAQKMQENSNGMILKKWLWSVFPELKESEDERVSKEIIDFLGLPHPQFVGKRDHEKWIAWLEKQGEQPTDKVEPKFEPQFKVGDWITDGYIYYKITEILDDRYIIESKYDKRGAILFEYENRYHLWTIEDAKDGDVLVNDTNIFIFHYLNGTRLMGYCHINIDNGRFYDDIGKNECFCLIDAVVNPATKEQRDMLFQKMTEAEYEWDSEKKEVKKIKVVSKESEDERIRQHLIDCVNRTISEASAFKDISKEDILAWLEKQGKEEYALKSFKDEDIRKFMQYIEKQAKAYEFNLPNRGYDIYAFAKDILYYLERQGEQKRTNKTTQMEKCSKCQFVYTGYCNGTCILKNNEQKPVDKVEPKFKLRDWIVDYVGHYWRVVKVRPNYYELEGDDGVKSIPTRKYVDEKYHLWTINDAKKGDILVVDGIWIVEFDKKMTDGCSWKEASILTSFEYDMDDDICTTGSHMFYKEIWPASKEDIDLFKKKRNEHLALNSHNESKFKVGDKV